MQYYRCKCGKRQAWGSMPPFRCARCEECGSDYAQSSSGHADPKPHRMVKTTVLHDGGTATLTRCRWCSMTLAQIEARGEPMETEP